MQRNGIRNEAFDHGFGQEWNDVAVFAREGYSTSVSDYHEHGFYEVNLIFSGNVKILLGDRCEEGTGSRMVLTRPGTPHYIACLPDVLYRRLYLAFSDDFVAGGLPEWNALAAVFGKDGQIVPLNEEQIAFFKSLIEDIGNEKSPLGKRLLIYYFLTRLSGLIEGEVPHARRAPPYVVGVISYLEKHYSERFCASDLARRMHVGRTTLMTGFRTYTGTTVGEYLTGCRLKNAARLLREGRTLENTAEACGFADSSGLIRAFRRVYGMTPRQYVKHSEGLDRKGDGASRSG